MRNATARILCRLTTLTRRPIALGGRFRRNFALTTPLFPCGRVTLPHITRSRLFWLLPGTELGLQKDSTRWITNDTKMDFTDQNKKEAKGTLIRHGTLFRTYALRPQTHPRRRASTEPWPGVILRRSKYLKTRLSRIFHVFLTLQNGVWRKVCKGTISWVSARLNCTSAWHQQR